MKTKIILLLSFLFSLVCGGTTEAKRSVDPLILKSDSILSYFMEGKGKELNAFLREDLKSKLPRKFWMDCLGSRKHKYGKQRNQSKWMKRIWEVSLYYKDRKT